MRRIRRHLVACLALALAGCGDEALVSFTFFEEPGFTPDLLVVEFSDGNRTRRLTASDFTDGSSRRRDTREFETRTSGVLLTEFWLVSGLDTLLTGEQRVHLRSDFRWNIGFHRADTDPANMCFGCAGSRGFELPPFLRSVPADSLWVVWGGNSISNPVVF